MKKLMVMGFLLSFILICVGQPPQTRFKVKYVSGANVYLSAGRVDGLEIGNCLVIEKNKRVIAEVEVEYLAEHSASCKVLHQTGIIETGCIAILVNKKEAGEKKKEPEVDRSKSFSAQEILETIEKKPTPRRLGRNPARVDGRIAFQIYYWDDQKNANLDFIQPTLRLNLKVRRLWGREYNLRLRSRARYNQRARRISSSVPREEWRNRIYEFSFSFDDPRAWINYRLGRIISNHFSGIGYIDGLLIQLNMMGELRFGVFAGTQPQWQYANFQTAIQKYGAYLNFSRGSYRGNHFESTIAVAGEYYSSIVSREFIYLQNSLSIRNGVSIYQSAEIDINRDWRKAKTGESISISNFYISARYRVTSRVSLGMSYDNRKNVWTYETRNVVDSLFNDVLRRGIRGTLSMRLPGRVILFSNVGIFKRETDSRATYSFSGGLNKQNFLNRRWFLGIHFAGFSNPLTNGYNLSTRLGQYLGRSSYLSLSYGRYFYQTSGEAVQRVNNWIRFNCQVNLVRQFFLSAQLESDFGEDIKGNRIFGEIGYQF